MYKKVELVEFSENKFITLKQAKQYLRVEHDYDNEMIQEMLDMTLIVAENYIGFALQEASWKMTIYNELSSFIKFQHVPVNKIIQFRIYRHNVATDLKEEDYFIDEFSEKLHLKKYYAIEKAEITYQVGYPKLPAPIRQGMLEHLAKLYDVRGGDQSLPIAAKTLYQAYKRVRL